MHTIRVAGVMLYKDKILLVKQRVSGDRSWSLPGGKLESGETIEQGIIREMKEETGLEVQIKKLLFLSEKPEKNLVHITFLLAAKNPADIRLPTNELETTPIYDIGYYEFDSLREKGFSPVWIDLLKNGFPNTPRYAGAKSNIGL